MTELFRPEAITFSGRRNFGSIVIRQPLALRVAVVVLAVLTLLVLTFLQQGQYARKETVTGQLRPDNGIVKVYSPSPGIAGPTIIRSGDLVRAGEPLLEVHNHWSLDDGEDGSDALIAELTRQESNLVERKARVVRKANQENIWLQEKLKNLERELAQQRRLHLLQLTRTRLSKRNFTNVENLFARGHAATSEVGRYQSALLTEQQAVIQIAQRINQIEMTISGITHELLLLPIAITDQTEAITFELSNLTQRITELRGRANHIVTAPVTGLVAAINFNEGDRVSASRSILTILPSDSKLFAWLHIPSRAVGMISKGQAVRLRYDSFPYQQFGSQRAEIVSLTRTAVDPSELQGPAITTEPVFVAKAALDKQTITVFGAEKALAPGSVFSADILKAERSILAWMLDPIQALQYRTGGIR